MCSLYSNTKACAIDTLITWLACFLHLAGAVLSAPFPITGIIQLVLWTIRQQSCTGEQICTCKCFGQKYQNLRRYRSFPRNKIVGVWFKEPVVWWVLQSHKLLYLVKGNTDLSYRCVFAKISTVFPQLYGHTVLVFLYEKTKLTEEFSVWVTPVAGLNLIR